MANHVRGKFLWHELMTSDTGSAEEFYGKVVGWKAKAWEQDPSYRMWLIGRRSMGGLMAQRVEPGQTSPLQWFTYIGTPDVDATVRQAVELGGRVMRPAWDIANIGRIAFLEDPQGAAFAVITPQPTSPPPGGGDQQPGLGDFSWHELITTNWPAAWGFYQKLFGWEKTSSMDMGPGQTYQMFGLNKIPMGGMYTTPPNQSDPPSWLPYAVVRDAKRTAEVIKQAGGTVVTGPMEIPGGDWIVVGLDRQGASLGMHAVGPAAAAKPALTTKKPALTTKLARAATRVVKRAAKKLRSVKKSFKAKTTIKSRPKKSATRAKPTRKAKKRR